MSVAEDLRTHLRVMLERTEHLDPDTAEDVAQMLISVITAAPAPDKVAATLVPVALACPGLSENPTLWRYAATCGQRTLQRLAWKSPYATSPEVAAHLRDYLSQANVALRADILATRTDVPDAEVTTWLAPMTKAGAVSVLTSLCRENLPWPDAVVYAAAEKISKNSHDVIADVNHGLATAMDRPSIALRVVYSTAFAPAERARAAANTAVSTAAIDTVIDDILEETIRTTRSQVASAHSSTSWLLLAQRPDLGYRAATLILEWASRYKEDTFHHGDLHKVAPAARERVKQIHVNDRVDRVAAHPEGLAAGVEAALSDVIQDKENLRRLLAAEPMTYAIAAHVAAWRGYSDVWAMVAASPCVPTWVFDDYDVALAMVHSPHTLPGHATSLLAAAPPEFREMIVNQAIGRKLPMGSTLWWRAAADDAYPGDLLGQVPLEVAMKGNLEPAAVLGLLAATLRTPARVAAFGAAAESESTYVASSLADILTVVDAAVGDDQ